MKIGRRAILGVLWSTGGKFAGFAVNFTGQLVLVHFLFPRDFGVFALVLSFFQVMTVVIDGNFPLGAIQMQEDTDLGDTAFALCVLQGGVILALSIAIASVIRWGHLFTAEVPWLFVILGLRYAIAAVAELYGAQLEKDFQYRSMTVVNAFSGILSTCVGVLFALRGGGVWSLAAREFFSILVLLAGYRMASGKRFRFEMKKTSVGKLLHFSKRMLVSSGLLATFDRMDNFLVGVFLGVGAVGFYSQARYLMELVHSSIHGANIVSFPLYANLKRDRIKVEESYRTLNFFLIRMMYPFCIVFALFPAEIVSLLFGNKWAPAAVAVRSLALYPVVIPVFTNLQFLLWGLGEIAMTAWVRGFQILCAAGLMSLGARFYGLGGASMGFMATIVIGLFAMQIWSHRRLALKGLWENLWAPSAAAAISMWIVFLFRHKGFQTLSFKQVLGLGALAVILYVVFLLAIEYRRLRTNIQGVMARLKNTESMGDAG